MLRRATFDRPLRSLLTAGTLATGCLLAASALAQQPAPAGGAPGKPTTAAAAKSAKPSGTAKSDGGGKADGAAAGGDGGLRQRVEQMEEQLVDMQVVIGTLESLAKSGGGAARSAASSSSSGGSLGAGDQGRIDSLETQVRALTQQVEQLTEQLRQARERRSEAAPAAAQRYGASTSAPGAPAGDPIGSLIAGGGAPSYSPQTGSAAAQPATSSQLPPVRETIADGAPAGASPVSTGGGDAAGPKQLYEQAYGHLLQQDYGAAEAAFDDFLKRYPSDALAGNAQYWLGESFFVRGQYKQAASAFLKGYQTYGKSAKAPDSLLKLAMSLDRLGQKEAACSSYGELTTRFPTAAQHIKARAQSERTRLACG